MEKKVGLQPMPGISRRVRPDGTTALMPTKAAFRWIKNVPVVQSDRVEDPGKHDLEHATEADIARSGLEKPPLIRPGCDKGNILPFDEQ